MASNPEDVRRQAMAELARRELARRQAAAPQQGAQAPGFVGPVPNLAEQTRADAIAQARGESAAAGGVVQGVRELGQGLTQFGAQLLESRGVVPAGTTERYTRSAQEQQQRAARESGLPPEMFEATNTAGQLTAGLLAPSVRASSFFGSIVKNALLGGGTAAAAEFQDDPELGDRLGTFGAGAAVGGLIGAAPGAVVGSWNYLTKSARELFADTNTVANRKLLDDMGQQLYTVGQATNDPLILGLENDVVGPNRSAMQWNQAQTVRQKWDEFLNTMAPRRAARGPLETSGPRTSTTAPPSAIPMTRGEQAERARNALIARRAELSRMQDDTWNAGIKRVRAIAGDTPLLQPKNFLRVYDEIIAAETNAILNPRASRMGRAFEAGRNEVARMVKDGATADELNALLVRINKIHGGESRVFVEGTAEANQMIAARLKEALFDDIGTMSLDPTKRQATMLLLMVRKRYRDLKEAENYLADTTIARFVGAKDSPQPAAWLNFIRSGDPEDQAMMVKLLETADPAALRAARAEAVQAAWQAATTRRGPAARNPFDLAKFSSELEKLTQGGLLNAEQKARAITTMDGIRQLVNLPPAPVAPAPLTGAEDITINAISRNPAFVARLITRLAEGKNLDRVLFTRQGQQAIRTLKTTTSASARAVAVSVLLGLQDPEPTGEEDGRTGGIAQGAGRQ